MREKQTVTKTLVVVMEVPSDKAREWDESYAEWVDDPEASPIETFVAKWSEWMVEVMYK